MYWTYCIFVAAKTESIESTWLLTKFPTLLIGWNFRSVMLLCYVLVFLASYSGKQRKDIHCKLLVKYSLHLGFLKVYIFLCIKTFSYFFWFIFIMFFFFPLSNFSANQPPYVGQVMVVSILQEGPPPAFLANWVYRYLCTPDVTTIPLIEDDTVNPDIRILVKRVIIFLVIAEQKSCTFVHLNTVTTPFSLYS